MVRQTAAEYLREMLEDTFPENTERRNCMETEEILNVIDEIIENANKIKELQEKIGASLIEVTKSILVYRTGTFLQYAETVGAKVMESGYVSKDTVLHHIRFYYKGYEFSAYVSQEELQEIREKVLPPTKVTEPNQNA